MELYLRFQEPCSGYEKLKKKKKIKNYILIRENKYWKFKMISCTIIVTLLNIISDDIWW